jgi:hypothetical protein
MSARQLALFVLLAGATLACANPFGPPADPGPRVVYANGGLLVRADASTDAPVVGKVPQGETLEVTGAPRGRMQAEGIDGRWVPVRQGTLEGYAFDGFLGKLPLPPPGCKELGDWVARLPHTEEPKLVWEEDCSHGEDMCGGRAWTTGLTGGGSYRREEGPEYLRETLVLPGASLPEAWLTARRCAIVEPDLTREPLPRVSETRHLPHPDTPDGYDVEFTVAPGTVQVESELGVHCELSIVRADDGRVTITAVNEV